MASLHFFYPKNHKLSDKRIRFIAKKYNLPQDEVLKIYRATYLSQKKENNCS